MIPNVCQVKIMADTDRSLDDIIKERKYSANRRGRGRFQGIKRNFNRVGQNQVVATGVKGRLGNLNGRLGNSNGRLGNPTPVADAREKLNAKARKTDARVTLNQKARQTDARARINAKRVKTGPRKEDEEEYDDDESVPQNVNSGGLTRTISNTNTRGQRTQPFQFSVENDVIPQTQFTIRNSSADRFTVRNTASATNLSLRKRISPPRKSASSDHFQVLVSNSGRDNFRSSGRLSLAPIQQSPTTKPPITLRQRAAMDNPRLGFSPPKVQRALPNTSDTGGPLRLTSNPRVRPAVDGTRVIITNLQITVTEEDIKELFGALGVLKRVRMVKQGVAEVIYSKREGALKAISTYHNRELDGKAMQCRLDSSSLAEGAPFKKNTISDRFKTYSSDNNPTLPYRTTVPASTVVELEDDIIDKVLFKLPVSSASTSKPVIFTVKI